VTAAVLADFGSTFTKVAVVELGSGRLLARSQSPTTVDTDVMRGYRSALDDALSALEEPVTLGPRRAASSAAGGLRVAAIGLVGDLTAAAARQAALNAGARIEVVLSGRLGEADRIALAKAAPEVVLFCGGTDGGQEAIVIANAEAIASAPIEAHFVVACNETVAERVGTILARNGARVDIVANVMPRIGEIVVEPARAAISEAFVTHVIKGKGLSDEPEFPRNVVMPTPEAVLRATRLLAEDLGDVIVVDIGGATTDVHSATERNEPTPGVRGPLLPLLPVLRSVQGDLGVRSNASSVLSSDRAWLLQALAVDEAGAEAAAAMRAREPRFVAVDSLDSSIDRALAVACAHHAIRRHCGRLTITAVPNQPARIATDGPDLRGAPLLIGTGGMLVHAESGADILSEALGRLDDRSLAPREPRISIDRDYLLAAAGLLADIDRPASAALMRASLRPR
jgi:uncharacterized protein (TIGR01319 family)